jgi:predicted enzyme related to lactoylglutathione lyase
MKVKHAYLTAENPEGLADFYTKIGLAVRFTDPGRWVQFATDGAAFCIASREESAVPPSSNAVVVFEVDDLDAALERAGEAGASMVAAVRNMGAHGRVAQIRDVENNTVQFFEPRPKVVGPVPEKS